MEKVNASYFKTHFGTVLDRATRWPVRIERRGRGAAVLLSEEAYEALQHRAALAVDEEEEALARLAAFAHGNAPDLDSLEEDLRGSAILKKHGKHWKS